MIYNQFQGRKLSALGFGAMRLPTLENGQVDEAQVAQMTRMAMEAGVNYFDTAWPYHGGTSETVMGRVLSAYPRDSYCLADKFPGHQISSGYDPADIFEKQLKKCRVDYFDFYLLHNVYENSMDVYLDEKWGILDYFREQRRLGRIRHLGFSTHAGLETLEKFLEIAGGDMEFCQIQLNWVDWTLQNAREKVALLNRYHIPIWVMEPVRGGKLCKLSEADEATLKGLRPEEGIPAWGFRFVQDIPGVTVILSGMSDLAQMRENLQTFDARSPLSDREREALLEIAEGMKASVPCTACRYCTDGCPMGLDIPRLIAAYNDLQFAATTNSAMWIELSPEDKKPTACIGCGKCSRVCPQGIDIPQILRSLSRKLETVPKWREICKLREEAARKAELL